MKKQELYDAISNINNRSAWNKGVNEYALELVEGLEMEDIPADTKELKTLLLNGAENWYQYSWGGSSLIYDFDIAERLCTPSELKKKKGGELNPNSREQWLDVQARALFQACNRICRTVRKMA